MNKRLKASLLSIMMAAVLALGIGLPDALLVRAASDDEQPKLFVPKTISGLASTEFTTSSSALPASPQGFTGGPAGDNSTSNGVVSGIIDTELKSFREHTDSVKDKDTYKLSSYYAAANEEPRQKPELLLTQENPTDGKVLMINNTSQTAYKYATSSMTLDANDYYKISVFVLTCDFLDIPGINSNSGAFIKLSGDIELRSEPINTKFVWQSYTMYVETRNFKSASVTFSLQVGDDGEEFLPAYGFALFDKLVATSITYEQYQRSVSAGQNDSRIIFNSESKSTSYLKDGADNYIHNGDFENGTASNWAKVEDTGFISISTEIINESDFTGAPMGGNKKAAVSSGSTASYGGIASDPFLIQRHRYYYISAYVDTTDIVSGSAVLKITSDEDNDSLDISNSSFTAASANHWRGDWQLASFYISGSAFADKLVNLELWLGSEAAPAKGTVYFDNINIEYITAEVFGASAGGTTVTFAGAVGTAGIANGGFNTIGNYEEFEYPLPVASWTAAGEYLDVENGQTVAGIIATDRTTWAANKDSYGAEINPIESVYGHNALMIWNKTSTYYSYTSETVSVAAAGYTKITVSLATLLESGAAYLSLVSSNNTIANIPDINTNGILTDYSFVIKGDWVGESVTLTIGLGTSERGKGASGHLFVDNALSVTSDEAAFDAVLGNAHSARYDFNLISFAGTGTGAVKAPSQWTPVTGSLTSVDINNVTAGIIDLDNFNAGSLGHLTKAQIGADNVTGPSLVIFSAVETAFGYRYAFPVTYATGKYYKLTLRVKTIGIPVGKGATISVDSENVFTNINTEYFLEDLNENTLVEYRTVGTESVLFNVGYVEYSFIINNTGDTSPVADGHNIQVMLGNSDKKANRTTGCVIIDDIAVAEIDATAFNEYANKLEVEEDETAPTNIINIGAAVAETGDTVEETPKTPIDWWVIPSAAFAFALILAVILIVIRKLLEMRTKHFKAATITYDRNTTLARMKKDARAVKASDDFEETPTESKRPDRTEPLTDDTAEPAAERKPRPKPAAPVAEPLVDAEVEPETVKPEPATPVIKPEVKPEIKPEVKAEEVKPEVKTEEVKAESVSEPEVKAEEGKPEVKPEIKAEEVKPEPVAEPEVKTEEVKAELVSEPEVKTEEGKPEVKPEIKAEEVKPEPVAEPEVKTEEVKAELVSEPEVKTEEVKAESVSEPEVKAEEVKAEVTAETETTEPVAEAEQTEPVAEAESTESTESVTEADDKKSEE